MRTVDLEDGQTGTQDETESSFEGLRQTWSLLYRRVAETGPEAGTPYAMYVLGVNPPPDTTDEELDVFNDFYTNVHLPEVAGRRHALRAVRYELLQEVRPPYKGAPQFLAVYEVDEKAASVRRHVGPPYATGPGGVAAAYHALAALVPPARCRGARREPVGVDDATPALMTSVPEPDASLLPDRGYLLGDAVDPSTPRRISRAATPIARRPGSSRARSLATATS